jgi:hypothetical protein
MKLEKILRSMSLAGLFCVVAPLGLSCGSSSSDPTGPYDPQEIYVEIHVTQGLAAADYAFAVDGATGTVRGISCVRLCQFEPGEVLMHLSAAQVVNLAGLLIDAGILDHDGADFGVQCCDQFHYAVEFRDGDRRSTVRGSSEAFPEELRVALGYVTALLVEKQPIIVDFDSQPADWPRDALVLRESSLQNPNLLLEVEYGGGCRDHELDLVAWGGWLESFPVQVNVQLAHEDFDDPCDALIQKSLRFDLTPLKAAYEESYGAGDPGSTTIIMRLTVPDGRGPRSISYSF